MSEEIFSYEDELEEDIKFIRSNQEAIKAYCSGCGYLKYDKDYDALVCKNTGLKGCVKRKKASVGGKTK